MLLPLPGAPSSTWEIYRSRLRANFGSSNVRVFTSFWIFGLINNIFYVIILSAALDLVGPDIPKGTVLLASIIPGLVTKIFVPYIIHLVPYTLRIFIFVTLSTIGMLAVALSRGRSATSIIAKIAGIIIANISSGAGEIHFLSLVHFYGKCSLSAWSSGTGGAGLIGAGAYALATTTFGLSAQMTLILGAALPMAMLFSHFLLLPLAPLETAWSAQSMGTEPEYLSVDANEEDFQQEAAGLLTESRVTSGICINNHSSAAAKNTVRDSIRERLTRTRPLLLPYMLPLFLVYAAEYTINQGISPTLLFPLKASPFKHYRDFYSTYGAIYQLGVFVSRSSLPFIRIRSLYAPSLLQIVNLVLLGAHAIYPFIPSVWSVFAIIFWEGLLGGLVYVSTFATVREEVVAEDREFSLGAVSVSDSAGICIAGFVGVALERSLCAWQVKRGQDWCTQL